METELEHPDEMPETERAPEIDPETLPATPDDDEEPEGVDEPVPEDTKGA